MNKKISIENFSEDANRNTYSFVLHKTWNYSDDTDELSETKDYLNVAFVKEASGWKINNIQGLSQMIFTDKDVCDDKITSYEKNVLFNSICKNRELNKITPDTISTPNKDVVSKNLLTASGYNRNNAVDYALAHAMSPNKNYPYYSLDCTNFVSQCLSAGGIRQHHGGKYSTNSWFFINDGNRSATWTGANELHNYFLSTGCKIKVSKSSFGSVDKGDIIQLMSGGDASHSMIVTGIVWASYGHADLMISCHTANRRHVSFYQAFPNANAEYFHISGSR